MCGDLHNRNKMVLGCEIAGWAMRCEVKVRLGVMYVWAAGVGTRRVTLASLSISLGIRVVPFGKVAAYQLQVGPDGCCVRPPCIASGSGRSGPGRSAGGRVSSFSLPAFFLGAVWGCCSQ